MTVSYEQMLSDAGYKISVKIIDALRATGQITEKQYKKINKLNIEKFKPTLAELYS